MLVVPADVEQARTRLELAAMFYGVGAELGVAAGDYSEAILRNQAVEKLYSVDRWSDHHNEAEFRTASEALGAFGDRSVILRATFDKACPTFADGFFDFIYVDGYAHEGQDGGRTLWEWWPKLKSGGIFSGHDYCPKYKRNMDAVDFFRGERGLDIHITKDDELSSWVTLKP